MANARQLFERGLMELKLKAKGLAKGKDTRVMPPTIDTYIPPTVPGKKYSPQRDENLGDPGGVLLVPTDRSGPQMGPGKREFDYVDPIGLPAQQKYKKRLLKS